MKFAVSRPSRSFGLRLQFAYGLTYSGLLRFTLAQISLYAPSVSPLRLCLCRLLLVAYRAAPVRKFAHPRRKIGAHLLKRPHLAATLRRIQAHKHRLWLCCSFCNKKLLTPFGHLGFFCLSGKSFITLSLSFTIALIYSGFRPFEKSASWISLSAQSCISAFRNLSVSCASNDFRLFGVPLRFSLREIRYRNFLLGQYILISILLFRLNENIFTIDFKKIF